MPARRIEPPLPGHRPWGGRRRHGLNPHLPGGLPAVDAPVARLAWLKVKLRASEWCRRDALKRADALDGGAERTELYALAAIFEQDRDELQAEIVALKEMEL